MKFKPLILVTMLVVVLTLSACSGTASLLKPLTDNGTNSNASLPVSGEETASQPHQAAVVPETKTDQVTSTSTPRQIVVAGTGKVYMVPDLAYITIGVHSQSEKVKTALADNNAQVEAVKKALTDMGIDEKDIQTSSFNIYPMPQYDKDGKITTTIYSIDNMMYVTVRDLSKLGQTLDAVVSSGANSINSIQFDVQDKDKALSDARKLAVEDAKKQADEYASAINAKLGNVLALSVNSASTGTPVYEKLAMDTANSSSSVPISAGQFLLTVNVTITYEIQ